MFRHPDVLNQWIQTICRLKDKNQDAVIVGGFVRDLLLKRVKTDIDIAVSSNALKLASKFAKSIKGVYVLLDEEHQCARVVKKIDDVPYTIDFSDYRAKTLKADLALRDFTVNSLTIPIHPKLTSEHLLSEIDDFSDGLRDLRLKKVRANAPRVFQDDPLRLLRAFSMSAQLGFTIERITLAQIKKDASLISQPASERVREEVFKILHSNNAVKTFRMLDKAGLLDIIIPQLSCMKGIEQGGYHHLDVWEHSVLVLEEFEQVIDGYRDNSKVMDFLNQEIGGDHTRLSLLKFACLLHDIGKPDTKRKEGDRFTFHTHEHVGAGITRYVGKQLRLTVKERYFLEDMVKLHLRPGYLSNFEQPSEKVIYRFMRDSQGEAVSLALLAMADQRATKGHLSTKEKLEHHAAICRDIIVRAFAPAKKSIPKERLLTGNDLMKTLKLKPSPLFAQILLTVEEEKSLGNINDKKEALALARKIADSHKAKS